MSEHIHTLQGFMLQTKGILYLLAICYFIGFVWFWKFLHDRNSNDD